MNVYGVAETRAHLSEILRRVEAGTEVTITRRGQPVATIRSALKLPTAADWARIAALRGKLSRSRQSAVKLVRQMRDADF